MLGYTKKIIILSQAGITNFNIANNQVSGVAKLEANRLGVKGTLTLLNVKSNLKGEFLLAIKNGNLLQLITMQNNMHNNFELDMDTDINSELSIGVFFKDANGISCVAEAANTLSDELLSLVKSKIRYGEEFVSSYKLQEPDKKSDYLIDRQNPQSNNLDELLQGIVSKINIDKINEHVNSNPISQNENTSQESTVNINQAAEFWSENQPSLYDEVIGIEEYNHSKLYVDTARLEDNYRDFYADNENQNKHGSLNDNSGISSTFHTDNNSTLHSLSEAAITGIDKTFAPIFYLRVKGQLDNIFALHPRLENLEKLVDNSIWSKIQYDQNKHYIVGLVSDKDNTPRYICYGVQASQKGEPPKELQGFTQWLPTNMGSPAQNGYWLMFQCCETGETINNEEI